jgi:methylmalonyl-CoA/ethylmalonyl-CoA epimerase
VTGAEALLPAEASFHHIGVACRDLDREQEGLATLGYQPAGARFVDQTQGIAGVFLEGSGPRLELLAPLPGRDVLDPWLHGAKMYHLAYEVDDLDGALVAAGRVRARQVSRPVPAVAFEGRRICFVMLRTMFLLELIEAPPAQA